MAWQKTKVRGRILLIKLAYFAAVIDCVERYLQFVGIELSDLRKICTFYLWYVGERCINTRKERGILVKIMVVQG